MCVCVVFALHSVYNFVFIYKNIVKMVEEKCKNWVFCIILKCRFQHVRDLKWRVVLGEYFFFF